MVCRITAYIQESNSSVLVLSTKENQREKEEEEEGGRRQRTKGQGLTGGVDLRRRMASVGGSAHWLVVNCSNAVVLA